MPAEQNYKNHARVVPMYHVGVFFPLVINLIWAFYRLRDGLTADTGVNLLLAIALVLMFISVRTQILTVQDRVIRLEMRQRLRDLLPAEVWARTAALPVQQVVALRFASDAELPGLVQEVLSGKLTTGKAIKARVQQWQPDHLRA